ncbi:hypothetical protein SAMN05877753_102359 [Bacillus oleivorans]|uniref:Uncharacterized protein n=1 Tax=Bacillus oleivorans TaxID=1448271 RepID=A0A285CKS9_9BACI|nr:hypothetical protein [Bacillus oleivorans]SNX68150.1 hypothetical protein SAMN05877753_102359 [Bacillus oleivorans]
MAYILKGVHCEKEGNVNQLSFFIQNNKIVSIRRHFRYTNCYYVDLSQYLISPAHVVADLSFPNLNFKDFKQYMINEFLLKGCTTLLVPFRVEYEFKWKEQLQKIRKQLVGSPIDYVLSVRIPARLVTPSIIRKCKREKISSIFVEITDETDLYRIEWGWMRDAMFPYPVTLIPHVLIEDKKRKIEKIEKWTSILSQVGIPFLEKPIPSFTPISKEELIKLGIYPQKGFLQVGGEVSYNLYYLPKSEDKTSILYDSRKLCITVDKGKVIRAGEDVSYLSGAGNEIPIYVPQFFQITS